MRDILVTNGTITFNLSELKRRGKNGRDITTDINKIMGLLVRRDFIFTGKVGRD